MSSSWKLQDAKARFSEVVRRAKEDGPQHVTVHGREEVVIVSADEFAKLREAQQPQKTGKDLIDALSLLRGLEITRDSVYSPIRPTPEFD